MLSKFQYLTLQSNKNLEIKIEIFSKTKSARNFRNNLN